MEREKRPKSIHLNPLRRHSTLRPSGSQDSATYWYRMLLLCQKWRRSKQGITACGQPSRSPHAFGPSLEGEHPRDICVSGHAPSWARQVCQNMISQVGGKIGEASAPTLDTIALMGRQGGPFEFGRLLDLSVEVMPTAKSSVVRVLQDQSFPISTLRLGSSILLLVQTHIHARKGMRQEKPNHTRQKSEDLIEDLEAELGDSQVEYMEGVQRAREAMRQIAALGCAPRRPARAAQAVGSRLEGEEEGEEEQENARKPRMPAASPRAAPPPVPLRHASLQQDLNRDRDRETSRMGSDKARRVTSRCGHAASTCISTQSGRLQVPPSSVAGVDGHFAPPRREANVPCVGLQSPANSDGREDTGASVSSALWKRRSLGAETLRGLLPLIADLSMTARDRETGGGPAREGLGAATPAVLVARAKGKKDAGRWAWGAWF
ncbi:hypothetical protein ACJZ2D_004359 [Fusarium nematophilum]